MRIWKFISVKLQKRFCSATKSKHRLGTLEQLIRDGAEQGGRKEASLKESLGGEVQFKVRQVITCTSRTVLFIIYTTDGFFYVKTWIENPKFIFISLSDIAFIADVKLECNLKVDLHLHMQR